ncbi:SprT-like domain-containing protein [Polyangium aurulentum]|uniref:SprT-like domain-containing protein n=1 Tax=Polyangium aurulentum TaxID=2567896 RepID=UPI00146D985F|nr:SprT-like domain-containing protein [Polyangium aurulentum]UQA59980.1 SprT-like domain-containing protein [Polyangium aurulentum]
MADRPRPFQMGQPTEPEPIDPRAPAHAVRQLVQQEGRQAPRTLYESFDAYNAEHFGGALKQSLILLTAPASPRAEGDYVAQDVHGIPSRIRIAPRFERIGILYLQDILLHEMIHAWQAEVMDDLENGYRGHGPKFCQKANEIGARLGLGPVAPKGRGGLPRPDYWPSNVRPPGYYGEQFPPAGGRRRGVRGGGGASGTSSGAGMSDPLLDGLSEIDRALVALLAEALGRPAGTLIGAWAREHARALASANPAVAAALEAIEKDGDLSAVPFKKDIQAHAA